jgi:murein DD-endopeptidase MepM/ murein hydrolase activator NlpD
VVGHSAARRVRKAFFFAIITSIIASAAVYAGSDRASTISNTIMGSVNESDSEGSAARASIPLAPPPTTGAESPSGGRAGSAGLNSLADPTAAPADRAAVATSVPECDSSQSVLYCVYEVKSGDTLSKIAEYFRYEDSNGIKSYEFLVHSNRPDIVSGYDLLRVGQKLRIPRGTNRILHTVLINETLSQVAQFYGSNIDAIVSIPENNITDRDSLSIGKELLIPDPRRLSPPAPTPTATPPSTATAAATATAPPPTSTPVSSGFIWPVSGPISSYFGPNHPLGIDIGLAANPNASIGAAKAGVVTLAGGNACCSYGLYVVVDHGDGDQTLYAHFSAISVSVGQMVAQGQGMGYGGVTGYATGNHLHFEVWRNGTVINPLLVLP